MTPLEALVPGVVFGVANSAHCAGMCGAFALRAGDGDPALVRMGLYLGGKTFTYLFLGSLAGMLGATLLPQFVGAQAALGIAVGLALVIVGVRILRPRGPRLGTSRLGAWFGRMLTPLFRGAAVAARHESPLTLGVLTGFLPCGLVYLAAAQAAATGSPASGASLMAGFGVGTMPVLLAIGLAGHSVIARLGASRVRIAGGLIVIIAGAVGIARAVMPLMAGDTAGAGLCCH